MDLGVIVSTILELTDQGTEVIKYNKSVVLLE